MSDSKFGKSSFSDHSMGDWLARLDDIQGAAIDLHTEERFRQLEPARLLDVCCRHLLARWRNGESPSIEEYLALFPSLNDVDSILELLDAEICGCSHQGLDPQERNLVGRFPGFADEINAMLALLQIERPERRSNESESATSKTCVPAGYDVSARFNTFETNGFLATEFATNRKILLIRVSEILNKEQRASLESRFNDLKKIEHPLASRLHSLAFDVQERAWVVTDRVQGRTFPERLRATLSDQLLTKWLAGIAALGVVLDSQSVAARWIDMSLILIDHNDQLVFPLWSVLLDSVPADRGWRVVIVGFLSDINCELQRGGESGLVTISNRMTSELASIERQCSAGFRNRLETLEAIWLRLTQIDSR